MGNISGGLSSSHANVSASISMDELDLDEFDASKIANKEKRETRKTPQYKALRATARDGVKDEHRIQFWKKATCAQDKFAQQYIQLSKQVFADIDDKDFPQFPLFGSRCVFESLKVSHRFEARKILVILGVVHDSLKFCPQLPYVVEMLLGYASADAVFSIVNAMLITSKHNNWYFRTDAYNFKLRMKTFMTIFSGNVKLVAQHITAHNIRINELLTEGFATMWRDYLDYSTFLRLIDTFCVEGYKVLFRVGVAILNHSQNALLRTKTVQEFRKAMIQESKKLKPNDLSRKAFSIYLTRDKFDRLERVHSRTLPEWSVSTQEEEEVVRRWPSLSQKYIKRSKILKNKTDFLQLWVWLPPGCHAGDFRLVYDSTEDGYQLSTLYQQCENVDQILLLIATTEGESFGFFLSTLGYPLPSSHPVKDPKSCAFMLDSPLETSPNRQVFERPGSVDHFYLRKQPKSKLQNRPSVGDEEEEKKGAASSEEDSDLDEVYVWLDGTSLSGYYDSDASPIKSPHLRSPKTGSLNRTQSQSKSKSKSKKKFNIPIVLAGKKSLTIGDNKTEALWIDASLNNGISKPCESLNSPKLVKNADGNFQIRSVEVWCVE